MIVLVLIINIVAVVIMIEVTWIKRDYIIILITSILMTSITLIIGIVFVTIITRFIITISIAIMIRIHEVLNYIGTFEGAIFLLEKLKKLKIFAMFNTGKKGSIS
jgi:hypothetical protein